MDMSMWPRALWMLLLSSHLCVASSSSNATRGDLEELEAHSSMTVASTTPCSATCGLGVRTQQLCPVSGGGPCRDRRVKCLDTWQCGMRTLTAAAGGRVELDCLGEVMRALGPYAYRVSWRFARGVVSTDNALFSRLAVPGLARLALEPLLESQAGTYRCDVQDKGHRRLKRTFYGLKVVPAELLRLDFASSLAKWDATPPPHGANGTQASSLLSSSGVKRSLFISITVCAVMATLLLLLFHSLVLGCIMRRRGTWGCRSGSNERNQEGAHPQTALSAEEVGEQLGSGALPGLWAYIVQNGLSHTVVLNGTEQKSLL